MTSVRSLHGTLSLLAIGTLLTVVGGGCLSEGEPLSAAEPAEGRSAAPSTPRRSVPEAERSVPDPVREGADWPRFLGPAGTGISSESDLIEHFPADGPPLLWRKEIGEGYGAPSIRGRRLVVHHREADREVIACLDVADGRLLWQDDYPTSFRDPYGYNGGPRCSPVLTEERAFSYGAGGVLTCNDLETGARLWQRPLADEFEIPEWFFGTGCSPIPYRDSLIVLVGGQPNAAVVAFRQEDGEILWQAGGKETWDGVATDTGRPYRWTGREQLVSYSSPVVREIHGKPHLLCLLRQGLLSLDPETGERRFRHWFRARVHESVNAPRPVLIEPDRIFLTGAYGTGSELIRVKPAADEPEVLWQSRRNLLAHWSTPIAVDDCLYGFSGRHQSEGELHCVEIESGKLLWAIDGSEAVEGELIRDPAGRGYLQKETGEPAPWPFFGRGSLLYVAGPKLWVVLGERGTLAIARLDRDGYEELARTGLEGIGYPSWAAPVLSRGRLVVRDEETLVCLDLRPQH